ncbi:hypothetical protein DUI87_15137 [Hirundo rustica rustica]|uniref:Lysosome-associated membrane glycoprotein 2 n=1 Tax=Hirundo rustica rustica TaxID=333673 RepID=A0A3M0K4L2_HIRRU|nr:hypothetical protein DUI87_15137 [Hirundo rustica rustica]
MGPRRSAASSCRRLLLPLLLLGVSGFFQSYAIEVDIKDASNATCLYADWMMRFLITYESNNGDYKTTTLNLSSSVTHNGSVCGNDTQAAVVAVQFGEGHSWSTNITKNNETYQGDFITLTYNTNDTAVFPDAKRKVFLPLFLEKQIRRTGLVVCRNVDCLRAKPVLININPKTTIADGACGNTTATLKLNDGNGTLIGFTFAVKNTSANVQKFYLREVNVTLLNRLNGSVISSADNSNFSKWDAFLGSSYMCRKEQTLQINEDVQVHTFNLWIQPFLVEANKFATAEECIADSDLNFLIPIAVGMALGFLIILVFISYIIGRRKSRTGYQSV